MKAMRFFSMFFLAGLLSITGLFAACSTITGGIRGDGNVLKETRNVSGFTAIDVSGAFDIILKQGDMESLVVEADANLLPVVRTEVVAGKLIIDTKKPIHNVTTMKVYITFKSIDKIDVSGAVDISTENRINVPELSIDASGASDSKLELGVKILKLDCSGASKIKLNGFSTEVKMDLSGASDIFAYDLLAESYSIEISGAGNAQINVSKSLRAEISGAGSVKYKGSPSAIDQEVSGAGSIKKVD
jgi:hypothetical protein